MLDHALLRSFVAVADSGSFTAAGRLIGRSTPAVSMQLKRLEELVGAPLLERSAQGTALTQRGEVLLIHARRILSAHNEALNSLAQASSPEIVSIGLPHEYVGSLLAPMLQQLDLHQLAATIRIHCEPSHVLLKRLDEGLVDIALVTEAQVGDERGDVVREERACWVCSESTDPSHFDPLLLAVDTEGCAFRRSAIEILTGLGRAHRLAVVGAHPVIRAAILSGNIVGLIPESTLEPGMRALGDAEGFPGLPPAVLRLRRGRRRSGVVDQIAEKLLAR